MHQRISAGYAPGDDLPCADAALLVPLKRSREYRQIRKRVASLRPVDSWEEDRLHFFVFQLHPEDGTDVNLDPPVAVFTMDPEDHALIAAVVVTPDGDEASVTDLRDPEQRYTAPLDTPADAVPPGSAITITLGVDEQNPGEPVVVVEASAETVDGEVKEEGALLMSLKRSREYTQIRHRIDDPWPADSWQEDALHFFAFTLLSANGIRSETDTPTAVFAMHSQSGELTAAVVVEPNGGQGPQIADLRRPELWVGVDSRGQAE